MIKTSLRLLGEDVYGHEMFGWDQLFSRTIVSLDFLALQLLGARDKKNFPKFFAKKIFF